MPRFLICAIAICFSFNSIAQNPLSGVWEGKFMSDAGLGEPRLVVEIYDFKDSSFNGITHLYYPGNKYEHYRMIGKYDKKNALVMMIESSTIAVDLGVFMNCLGTYIMQLSRDDDNMLLTGIWKANKRKCTSDTKTWLAKKVEKIRELPVPVIKPPIVKKNDPAKKPDPVVKPPKEKKAPDVIKIDPAPPVKIPEPKIAVPLPAKLSQRETDVQSLLEISSAEKDSIKVEVYDNGDIDGDSVSVYEEGIVRVNRKMISANPITFYISLNKNVNPIAHLRMVAESLGAIPPCTALMIVTTRLKRYEVRLSSNFNKNATVELFLKE